MTNDLKKIDKENKKYNKKILSKVNNNCTRSQQYIHSFKDTYTGWSIPNQSNIKLPQFKK